MSEQLTWEAMDEKERVRWLLEHVMGYYILPDSACVSGHLDIPKGLEGFHWPIAYWDGPIIDGWYTEDSATIPDLFNPLHDFNDAWLLIKRLAELYGDVTEAPFDLWRLWPKYDFMHHMGLYQPYEGEQDESVITVAHLATWTPARIAEAVYHAVERQLREQKR